MSIHPTRFSHPFIVPECAAPCHAICCYPRPFVASNHRTCLSRSFIVSICHVRLSNSTPLATPAVDSSISGDVLSLSKWTRSRRPQIPTLVAQCQYPQLSSCTPSLNHNKSCFTYTERVPTLKANPTFSSITHCPRNMSVIRARGETRITIRHEETRDPSHHQHQSLSRCRSPNHYHHCNSPPPKSGYNRQS